MDSARAGDAREFTRGAAGARSEAEVLVVVVTDGGDDEVEFAGVVVDALEEERIGVRRHTRHAWSRSWVNIVAGSGTPGTTGGMYDCSRLTGV